MNMDKKAVTDALAWLKGFDRFHIRPGLERMEAMLEALGRPEQGLRFLHIAGTNGKGSTGAFMTGILREHGFSVGVFSSPAIMHELDRIQYNGNRITDADFLTCVKRVRQAVDGLQDPPTEFEVITVLALVYFDRIHPDWVIWETGLGGQWDSTNVVEPYVTVITNIGHDHMAVLGETIPQIAAEKAGIIKAGRPVVTAADSVAETVIRTRAEQLDCPYFQLNDRVQIRVHDKQSEGSSFTYKGLCHKWDELVIRLPGGYQLSNASLALLTIEILAKQGLVTLDDHLVKSGLLKTEWPGRMELISKHPRILLDAAHNPEAAAQLVDTLKTYFTYSKLCLIIGIFADKDVTAVAKPLGQLADDVIATSGCHPRYMPADALAGNLRNWCNGTVTAVPKAEEAVREALERCGTDDLILIAGSHDLMSTMRKYFVAETKLKVGDGR